MQAAVALRVIPLMLGTLLFNPVRILFLGNSITLHGPKPDIGWTGNWGMAASAEEMTRTVDQVETVSVELRDAGRGVQDALQKLDANVEAMAEQSRRTGSDADAAVLAWFRENTAK